MSIEQKAREWISRRYSLCPMLHVISYDMHHRHSRERCNISCLAGCLYRNPPTQARGYQVPEVRREDRDLSDEPETNARSAGILTPARSYVASSGAPMPRSVWVRRSSRSSSKPPSASALIFPLFGVYLTGLPFLVRPKKEALFVFCRCSFPAYNSFDTFRYFALNSRKRVRNTRLKF
jgi:hypothetical protein